MSKPFPLQTLLDLTRRENDTAAARLGTLNGHDREMEDRLRLLLDYRDDYASRLLNMTTNGVNSVGWKNCREFIAKIDSAIVQQRQTVAEAKCQVQSGRHQWYMLQRKLKSFDTLSDRHRAVELKRESKLEQKEQDEWAIKGAVRTRASSG